MNLVPFSNPDIARGLLEHIAANAARCEAIRIMEVCGTHTMEIGRLGLRHLLPANVHLISGPGCPVCVTPSRIIDAAIDIAMRPGSTLCTFGDMVRVPGTQRSLQDARADGARVSVVTSPLTIIDMAREDPEMQFVFVAVGFETTIPVVARTIQIAREHALSNICVLVAHRILPPALEALCADPAIGIQGFLLPGHVSAILGTHAYDRIRGLDIPAAITGFEPLDILAGVHAVVTMCAEKTTAIQNVYPRVVKPGGNPLARAAIDAVFEPMDADWRGIGEIPRSGLRLRNEYAAFDAADKFDIPMPPSVMPKGCSCGSVLRGIMRPDECPLFANSCTPASPVGPCMVSSEGACAAYYRYERHMR